MLHINLDSESYNFRPYLSDIEAEILLKSKIDKNEKFIINENNIVFSIVTEDFSWDIIDDKLIPILYKYIDKLSEKNIYWILNNVAKYYNFKNIKNILYIDFFALKTYYKIFLKGHSHNTKWNSNSTIGLFLPGKLNKIHRIGLLYFLYKKNLLEKCTYSTYFNFNTVDELKNILFEIEEECDINIDHFLLKYNNKLDNIVSCDDNSFSHSGFPYDTTLYEKTSISLITETFWSNSHVWITEKTYRAIANKHPFIMIGTTGLNNKLNDIGFKTFENFMIHKKYNSHFNDNISVNFELICQNFDYFLNNFSNYKFEINIDIEHNYNTFLSYCKIEIDRIIYFLNISSELKDNYIDNLLHEMDVQNYL